MRIHPVLAALVLLTAPTSVLASSTEPTLEISTGMSAAFNQTACQDPTSAVSVVYDIPSSYIGTKATIFITDSGSCPDDPPNAESTLLSQTTLTANNLTNTITIKGTKFVAECPANVTQEFLVCMVIKQTGYNTTGTSTDSKIFDDSVTITYDSTQPGKPVITGSTGVDSAVVFTWDKQDGVDHWVVYYKTNGKAPDENTDICSTISTGSSGLNECAAYDYDAGDGLDACTVRPDAGLDAGPTWDASPSFDGTGWESATISDGTAGTGRVSGLVNDQQYVFVLVAVDLAGNESTGSESVTGTPLTVHDFYRRYQCAGGQEKGGFGCSTAGMAVLLPAAALGVLALLRRRRAS